MGGTGAKGTPWPPAPAPGAAARGPPPGPKSFLRASMIDRRISLIFSLIASRAASRASRILSLIFPSPKAAANAFSRGRMRT